MTILLTGQSLLNYHNEKMELVKLGTLSRTDMIKDAGYVYDNGKAQYVDYYTEVLNAQGILPVANRDVVELQYDELDGDDKALYDLVDQQFGEKWDHEQVMEFIEELKELDIHDVDSFNEYYVGRYDTKKEFAQEHYENHVIDGSDLYYYIDWDGVASELEYDYDFLEYDWEYFVFRKG
jgi:hypothetical protein